MPMVFWFPSVLLPQGSKGGVHNVHTLGFGSGRTGAGLGRIAEFGGSGGFARAGTRFESHLGHSVFARSGAFWCFFHVDSVHTFASDLMFRVCGVPDRPIRLWGSG